MTRFRLAILTLEAIAALAGSRLALLVLSWRQAMAVSGGAAPAVSRSSASFSATALEQAIRRARRFVPGATCLAQALALRRLLTRYGHPSTVQIGVTTADGRFSAHAWIESGGAALLCSARELERYAPLYSWPPAPSPAPR